MPRVARGLADELIYHIINRGNGRQQVFHKEQDYRAFLERMEESIRRYSVRLYAHCLLSNHFHLLVSPVPVALPGNWAQFVDEPMTDSEMEKLRRSVHRQTPYGEEEWQMKISSMLGLASTLNPRVRPRKAGPEK